jgi:Tol biopolymer transport system component
MSPEQAKGQEADRRSDVWAFGCVLFEMLAGKPAFDGGTSSEIIASVLKTDPDWRRLPAGTPESVRRLLRRCLEKDDRRRLRDIADARLEIDEAGREITSPRPVPTPGRRVERFVWGAAVAVVALVAIAIGMRAVPSAPDGSEVQFDIITPPVPDPEYLHSLALSPDGQTVAFSGNSNGEPHVWVRSLNSVVPRPLAGTARGRFPFWSPDSRSVAFFADDQLKRIDLDGGLVRTLAPATYGFGGSWNRDGVIVFAPNPASPLFRTSADGATPVSATRLDPSHAGHTRPTFLPDGRHFLFIVNSSSPEMRGVYVGDLGGSPSRRLVDGDTAAAYVSGHLFFDRQATLFAQKFDAERLELQGSPSSVIDGIVRGSYASPLAVAAGGIVAVRVGRAQADRELVWIDRSGKEIETVGNLGNNATALTLSPDGGRLVFFRRDAGDSDLWQLELRRKILSRLTTNPSEDIFPAWVRDGSGILFSSNHGGFALFKKPATGNEAETLVLDGSPEETFACDTTPDGRVLVFQRRNAKTGWDLWSMPLTGTAPPVPVVQTAFDEANAQLSPDGKWIAYVANGSGQYEVYVQPFPGPGERQQVSTSGGAKPRWSPDGKEFFYVSPDGKLTAVPITLSTPGQLVFGTPVPLFVARMAGAVAQLPAADYVTSPDGRRFLVNVSRFDSNTAPIRLIVNWKPQP